MALIYKIRNKKYKIQNTKYKIQNTKYKIQNDYGTVLVRGLALMALTHEGDC